MDMLSHLRNRFFWAEKASNVLTKFISKDLDYVENIKVYYDANNDLRILVQIKRPVYDQEITLVKDEIKKYKILLSGVSPIFKHDKYVPISIKTVDIEKNKTLNERVLETLKKLKSVL